MTDIHTIDITALIDYPETRESAQAFKDLYPICCSGDLSRKEQAKCDQRLLNLAKYLYIAIPNRPQHLKIRELYELIKTHEKEFAEAETEHRNEAANTSPEVETE